MIQNIIQTIFMFIVLAVLVGLAKYYNHKACEKEMLLLENEIEDETIDKIQQAYSQIKNYLNHMPDNHSEEPLEKVSLTKEQVVKIIQKVQCSYCEVIHHTEECHECELYENFKPNDYFIQEVNALLESK